MWAADTMMQVQMPKFTTLANILAVYTKKRRLGLHRGPHSNCCLSVYLNIASVRQGSGYMLLGSCNVLEIFASKRVGTLGLGVVVHFSWLY